jgi:fucose 4-O-acetylase-like acetyltransferase
MVVKERIELLDNAKGLAIALVVLGHIVGREFPKGNNWFIVFRDSLYSFHMPLFMFLSGFVLFYSYKKVQNIDEYKNYAIKKFYRLIPGFLLFSIIIFLGKYVSQFYMHVDNPVNEFKDFIKIFIQPIKSFSFYLWYIYVLFEYYLFIPVFLVLTKNNYKYILSISFVISALTYFVNVTTLFALNQFCEYLFFICWGGFVSKNYRSIFDLFAKSKYGFLILFFCALIAGYYLKLPKIFIGFISIPAIIALLSTQLFSKAEHLSMLGNYTLPIYFMNTIFIGIGKGIIFKFTNWDFHNFIFIAPVLFLMGLYPPIFVKKYLLRYVPVLDKIIR